MPENKIHLCAFGEIVANAESQSGIILRTKHLRNVFQAIMPRIAPFPFNAYCSQRQSQIVDKNQNIFQWDILLVHPILYSVAT